MCSAFIHFFVLGAPGESKGRTTRQTSWTYLLHWVPPSWRSAPWKSLLWPTNDLLAKKTECYHNQTRFHSKIPNCVPWTSEKVRGALEKFLVPLGLHVWLISRTFFSSSEVLWTPSFNGDHWTDLCTWVVHYRKGK